MKTKLSVFCEKVIEAGWLISLVSVPLYFNIYTARTFEPDKITLLRMITAVMVLASAVMVAERGFNIARQDGKSFKQRLGEWIWIPFVLPTIIFAASYVMSALLSLSPTVSFWGSYQRLQGAYSMLSYIILFVMIALHLRTREQIDRLVTVVIITSIPISLYGIVQKFGLDPLPWAGDVTRRVASTLGNAIFVSSYIIMVTPLTLMRLVSSMSAIIKEEKASWGHTILAAIYIFTLAIQTLAIIYSGSRGPMIAILVALFIMGLMLLLTLRQINTDTTALTPKEVLLGLAFVVPLGGISLVVGGVGAGFGYGFEALLQSFNYQGVEQLTILGFVLGSMCGLFGLYVYMATVKQGWRWLWLSWIGLAVVGAVFIGLLNYRGTAMDPYLEPIRQVPHLNRLTTITDTDSGTGQVRILIWDAAFNLVLPHDPMGVPNDPASPVDTLSFLRPLIGYGPESMFNAFAYAYPPDLAYVEKRGSSADRSHNETMDSLVITGVIGFLAYYYIMVSVFVYGLVWTGWTPDKAAKRRLYITLIASTIIGGALSYIISGQRVFLPLGLPAGLTMGLIIHLVWQGIVGTKQRDFSDESFLTQNHLLLIGLLGATVAHFVEVHFVFSIAATYTYFWAYRGLMLAIDRMEVARQEAIETAATESSEASSEAVEAIPPKPERTTRRGKSARRGRGRRNQPAASPVGNAVAAVSNRAGRVSWEMIIAGYGLTLSIIMIILTFDFITPQFEFSLDDQDSMSLLWMYLITWGIGLAIALSDIVIRKDEWRTEIHWGRAVALYAVSSLSYFFLYYIVHQFQFGRQIAVATPADAIGAANVLVYGLLTLLLFLLLLMCLFAVILSWQQLKRLQLWRSENWWLYPALAGMVLALIWFKNFNVVRADIYLKEGERYRNAKQWEHAIALHELGRDIDSDEDFYYLMLALDYQLMAQDNRLDPAQRAQAQQRGEEIALEARLVNPYNPDNTGNMGRYYFTLSQVSQDPQARREYLELANDFFRKATILAPTNAIYHNLWAQAAYIEGNYDLAIERLETSLEVDYEYRPTWVLLGDSYAAKGDIENALAAHSKGMQPVFGAGDAGGFGSFADQSLDPRLNFYASAGRIDELLPAMEAVAWAYPENLLVYETIAKAYTRSNQADKAIPYYEQAVVIADGLIATERIESRQNNYRNRQRSVLQNLGNLYLSQERFSKSITTYERVVEIAPNDVQSRSALAYSYAKQNRFEEAVAQHQLVLQREPENYESLQNLAVLYQQLGQWQNAIDTARRAMMVADEGQIPQWEQFIANAQNQLATNGGTEFDR